VLLLFVILPGFVIAITRLSKEQLMSPRISYLMGNLYQNLNLREKNSFYYPLVFFCRRLVIGFLMIFMQNWDGGQVICLLYMNLFIMIFTSGNKLFQERRQNYTESINESVIYYLTILSTLFTDYNPSNELRYSIGWIYILVVAATLLFNLSMVYN
jgi:hypothetical protein